MYNENYSLNWDTFPDHLLSVMAELFASNHLTDVTLVCDDKKILRAHKIILSSSSSVFKNILSELTQNNSVIYLRGINHQEMESILKFMYLGTITLDKNRFDEFLNVALSLEVKEINKINVEPAKEEVLLQESEIPDDGNSLDVDAHNVEEDKSRSPECDAIERSIETTETLPEENNMNGNCGNNDEEGESRSPECDATIERSIETTESLSEENNIIGNCDINDEEYEESTSVEVNIGNSASSITQNLVVKENLHDKGNINFDNDFDFEEAETFGVIKQIQKEKLYIHNLRNESRSTREYEIATSGVIKQVSTYSQENEDSVEVEDNFMEIEDDSGQSESVKCAEGNVKLNLDMNSKMFAKTEKTRILSTDSCIKVPTIIQSTSDTGKAEYSCKNCAYETTDRSNFKRHIKTLHKDIKCTLYTCDSCGDQWTDKGNLLKHIKSKHTDLGKNLRKTVYSCTNCDYNSTNKTNLRRHNDSIHEGVKYACTQCDDQLTDKGNLSKHMKVKHNMKITYPCNRCHRIFKGTEHLKRHKCLISEVEC